MDWVLLGLGIFFTALAIPFMRDHQRGVRKWPYAPNPLFHVILYLTSGGLLFLWAFVKWVV